MPKVLGVKVGSVDASDEVTKKDRIHVRRKRITSTSYVLGDTLSDTEEDILATSGIPALWSPLRGALCKSRTPKEVDRVINPNTGVACGLWEVTAEFDSDVDPDECTDDPSCKTPIVRWHGETEEEVLEKDAITGEPVQTAAGEPILITSPYVLPVLEIKRYETYPFDPNVMLDYSHRTNAEVFWGAPIGSALMLPMEVDEETINQVKYAVPTYRIKFKIKPDLDEPWKARVLHHGFQYLDENEGGSGSGSACGEGIVYRDKFGNSATINLAEDGTLLPLCDPPNFLEFNRFTKIDFNNLSLGPF